MAKAIKMLVAAFENSGKSTITSSIQDAMVINFDRKEYGFQVPHINVTNFTGIDALIALINEKLGAYKAKFGKLPSTVVFDTVTQFYTAMQKFNNDKFTGFNIHSANNKDTMGINDYIENVLIVNGINVIIVAHTTYDVDTARHVIPASGQFSKAGSWLSVVNDSIFIEKKNNKLVVHQKTMKFPCRSTLANIEESIDMDKYDINDHIRRLTEAKVEADGFRL